MIARSNQCQMFVKRCKQSRHAIEHATDSIDVRQFSRQDYIDIRESVFVPSNPASNQRCRHSHAMLTIAEHNDSTYMIHNRGKMNGLIPLMIPRSRIASRVN